MAIGRIGQQARPLEVPNRHWHRIFFDFITDLPPSGKEKYTRLAVFCDMFSKRVILEPCKNNIKSVEFAQLFISQCFRITGIPEIWHSDCDAVVDTAMFRALLEGIGVKDKFGILMRKALQGQVESMNSTVASVLRSVLQTFCKDHKDWAEPHIISVTEFTINSHVSSATGLSPFVASQGWTPSWGMLDEVAPPTKDEPLSKRMKEIKEYIELRLINAQQHALEIGSVRKISPREFRVGQWVWVANQKGRLNNKWHKKLGDRQVGPFAVQKVLGNRRYQLELPDELHSRIRNVFSSEDLYPCQDPRYEPLETHINDNGEEEILHEIKAIKSHVMKNEKGKRVLDGVLIQWKGKMWEDSKFDMWQKALDMATYAPDMLKEYIMKKKIKIGKDVDDLLKQNTSE